MEHNNTIKIAAKMSSETTSVLKALKDMGSVLEELRSGGDGFDDTVIEKVATDLIDCGVNPRALDLFKSFQQRWAEWSSALQGKINGQAEQLAKDVSVFKLPVYNPGDHPSSAKEFARATSSMQKVAAAVSKLSAFQAAATMTGKLSGLDFELMQLASNLTDARTFIYVCTILSILAAPSWQSMTKAIAENANTTGGQLVANLQLALKQAANDGIALPGELQAKVSEQLGKFGVCL